MTLLQYADYADDRVKNDRPQPKKVKVRNYAKLAVTDIDVQPAFSEPNTVHFLPLSPKVSEGNNLGAFFYTCWVRSSFESLTPWRDADDAIKSWVGLQSDWDGCDGTPPSADSLTAAKSFVRRAKHARVPEGDPYITGDGEIGFQWDDEDEVATVSFLADGRYFAFCPRRKENAVRISGVLTDADDVLELFDALRAFA